MPSLEAVGSGANAADVEQWLGDLGLTPLERADREGITSWDLKLDGLRRFDIGVTVILDPTLALIVWVHFAPPIMDRFRVSYRKLLRWNDEFPFAKFAIAADGRPVLTSELSMRLLTSDEVGLAITRLLAICDVLLEESAGWLWIGGRIPDAGERASRHAALFARYEDRLGDLRPA